MCMEACTLHTGYHKVPSRKMIWELMGDCRNDFIADSIRRDVLEAVMTNIHFQDNAYADNDPGVYILTQFAKLFCMCHVGNDKLF